MVMPLNISPQRHIVNTLCAVKKAKLQPIKPSTQASAGEPTSTTHKKNARTHIYDTINHSKKETHTTNKVEDVPNWQYYLKNNGIYIYAKPINFT